jgi:2-oxoglutarate ferredoxin oxidoreductase subunit delta
MSFTVLIDAERCKGCALCVALCPRGVLKPSNRLNTNGFTVPVVEAPVACTGCLQCAQICPDCAIAVQQGQGENSASAQAGSACGATPRRSNYPMLEPV